MKILYFITLYIACPVFISGQDLTVDQITENLQRRYEMVDDATIKFEKHVKLGYSDIEQNFAGTLMMKKPNKYCLESEYQTFVTDGVTVWVYSAANKQVIIDKYKENTNSISPEQFVLRLPSDYYTSITDIEQTGSGRTIQLKLIPKDDRSFIKSVKLTVEESDWLIRRIVITDVGGTETSYAVRDIKLNTNIPDKKFSFEIPGGVEVVDIR